MQPDPTTTMLELLGLRKITVPNLGRRAVLVESHRLLLVDAGIGSGVLAEVVDGILTQAAADLAHEG